MRSFNRTHCTVWLRRRKPPLQAYDASYVKPPGAVSRQNWAWKSALGSPFQGLSGHVFLWLLGAPLVIAMMGLGNDDGGQNNVGREGGGWS